MTVENDDRFRRFLDQGDLGIGVVLGRFCLRLPRLPRDTARNGPADGEAERARRFRFLAEAVFCTRFDGLRLQRRIVGADGDDRGVRPQRNDAAQELERRRSAGADIDDERVDARNEQRIDAVLQGRKFKLEERPRLSRRSARDRCRALPRC